MNNSAQKAVLSACREFLRPIARLLLKNGVSYPEFADLCKEAFVQVASDDYGIRKRKTNMSRVAVMTGLSRKEVKKVRNRLGDNTELPKYRMRRPELILTKWHSDPAFLDDNNQPKKITFDGEGATFSALVAQVGGDIPPKAMLNELLRAGSVVKKGDELRIISRSYIPEPHDSEAIELGGGAIRHLVSTINHNLDCDDPDMRFFERRVYSELLPRFQRARFKKLAREKGDVLLRDLHAWLSEREKKLGEVQPSPSIQSDIPRIGVGVYFFNDYDVDEEIVEENDA